MVDIEKAVTEKAEACERHLTDEYTWMKHRHDYNATPHFSDGYVASEVRMLMRDQLNHEAVVTTAANRICRLAIENATLKAENEKLREALGRLGRFFTNAEQEAGYLVANEEETGIGDIKEALEAVVFNDDGQDFLFWVQYARKAMEKSND